MKHVLIHANIIPYKNKPEHVTCDVYIVLYFWWIIHNYMQKTEQKLWKFAEFIPFMPSPAISGGRLCVYWLSVHPCVRRASLRDHIPKCLLLACGNVTKFTHLMQLAMKMNWLDFEVKTTQRSKSRRDQIWSKHLVWKFTFPAVGRWRPYTGSLKCYPKLFESSVGIVHVTGYVVHCNELQDIAEWTS